MIHRQRRADQARLGRFSLFPQSLRGVALLIILDILNGPDRCQGPPLLCQRNRFLSLPS